MALTSVRARLGDVWTTLTYNPATGRWEGLLLPDRTSIHQPGGYYSVEVEASSDSGETASITGDALASLRLVVRETESPVLTLVSPAAGYVTVKRPAVVMDALDETGGSGVDPVTWRVFLDGVPQGGGTAGGKAAEPIPGGYRLTWTPQADLSEGRHMVAFTVSDRDGNEAGASAAYIVDTVPPTLALVLPDSHRVVDGETITVAGTVSDATSGVSEVTVGRTAAPVAGGAFTISVPLEIGVNSIPVTARDAAGWTASQPLTVIRLVTDRTQADVERVLELCTRGYARWTAEERAWWRDARCHRGNYDALDVNRVTAAMEHIQGWLERYGYLTEYRPEPHSPWTDADAMTASQGARYIRNVEALRSALPLPEDTPETPESLKNLTVQAANDIETILVAVDAVRPVMERSSWWPCGSMICGGVF